MPKLKAEALAPPITALVAKSPESLSNTTEMQTAALKRPLCAQRASSTVTDSES